MAEFLTCLLASQCVSRPPDWSYDNERDLNGDILKTVGRCKRNFNCIF